MAETVVLDPAAVATSRTAVDITAFIAAEGADWGDAAIEAHLAKGHVGSIPVDFDIPNRIVTIPLKLVTRGAVTFDTIRAQLQAKVGLFHREGGWISRQTSVGTMYADVVSATLKLGGDWFQAYKGFDVNAVLTLELVPDWYGAERTLDDKAETTALALTTVLKQSAADAVIAGDHPGRVRIVADEDQGQTQLGLIWGFRSQFYDSASTAALTYQAEALTPLATAGTATLTGASGGTVVQHTAVRTDWTAVLSTTILSGSAQMTHRGTYRVWSRVYSNSSPPPDMRFVWKVGDLVNPSENDRRAIPATSNFYWLDLGEIQLDAPPVGTHLWQGQIEAIGTVGGENVSVDAVHFVPVDDGYGILRAPQIHSTPTAIEAMDSFTGTTAGNALNGRIAPAGGTWATSGDAGDFTFEDTPQEAIERGTTSDTAGRYAVLGTSNYTDTEVSVDLSRSTFPTVAATVELGVLARWADASNHLWAKYQLTRTSLGMFLHKLILTQVVSGSSSDLASVSISSVSTDTFYSLRLTVRTTGLAVVTLSDINGLSVGEAVASSAALATGGALASGKPGIRDKSTATNAISRDYDEFRVVVPTQPDATLYPNQSLELRTDGIFRENAAGSSYAPAPHVGRLPRIPVSGLENRKVELYLNQSRGDFDQIPDTGIDDISAQVFYRPSWLIIPGS